MSLVEIKLKKHLVCNLLHIVRLIMTKLIILFQLKCVSNGENMKKKRKRDDNPMAHSAGKCHFLIPSCLVFTTFHSHQWLIEVFNCVYDI